MSSNKKLRSRLDKISIRNILSIRYNPEETSQIKPVTWKDFKKTESDPDGRKVERLIRNNILKKIEPEDGPICVSLSGGIDSTLCLGLLRKCMPDRKIISICGVFKEGFDESKTAKSVAKKFSSDFKIVKMESIFTKMPELISIANKPKWNTYQHLIAKEAKKHGSVLVTGDGADELFGGYVFRYSKFLSLSRSGDNWKLKTINYLECHNRDWVPDQESMYGSRIKFSWEQIYKYLKQFFSNPLPPLKQVMLADYNGKLLFDFIPAAEMIIKYYNLEHIPIYLSQDVKKLALSLPLEQKYNKKNQKGKLVLRRIAKRFGIKHLEQKRGFSSNLWFDWEEKGRKICQKYLLEKDNNIYYEKLINFNWVLRAFDKVENDGDIRYLNRLISILALEIWYRIFVTKEMRGTKKL